MLNLIVSNNRKPNIRLSRSAKPVKTIRYCLLLIISLIGLNTVFAQGNNVTYEEAVASLKINRDRLLTEYANRYELYSARRMWSGMTNVQKGVFLTLTDYLGRRSFLNNSYGTRTEFDMMLNHVTKIYTIRGSNNSDCGGIDYNRMYFQVDDALMYNIRNVQFLPNWRNSTDLNGPHSPFTQSREGISGKPRAQIHEWAWDFESQPVYRPGVGGINDPRIVEMDIDYDFLHHSNPQCTYDGISGRSLYQSFYYNYGLGGSAEYDYIPTKRAVGSTVYGRLDNITTQYPIIVSGWTLIPNEPQTSAEVAFFIDGNPWDEYTSFFVRQSNFPRPDVNEETEVAGNHGFEFRIPDRFCDGNIHYITTYASRGTLASLPLENGSFRTFSCAPTSHRVQYDFNGDGSADLALFRDNSVWLRNLTYYAVMLPQYYFQASPVQFGQPGDIPVPADYDGDAIADIAVFRPSDGVWYRLNSSNNQFVAIQFGYGTDKPAVQDYDGDGKADITVFRPSNGIWYRLDTSTNQFIATPFGLNGDKPVAQDYDGDGKADIAVFRPSDGIWHRLNSSTNQYVAIQFGLGTDKPIAQDYDGDGKADIAVFRPSDGGWHRLNSSTNQYVAVQFGQAGDIPTPADYDGDGKTDLAFWHPSTGMWNVQASQVGFYTYQFGNSTDIPLVAAANP